MADIASPKLQLQADLTNRPYGGGWWPAGHGVEHELQDLVRRWPADQPKILRYSYIHEGWDQSESAVPTRFRTRTLVLVLSDRSSCRLLMIPPETSATVAAELLGEASNPHSTWKRMDFVSTFRS
jgi:hypothetical protein